MCHTEDFVTTVILRFGLCQSPFKRLYLQAPRGRRIVIQFVGDFNIYCFADRCRHWVEVRYKGDLGLPGPR